MRISNIETSDLNFGTVKIRIRGQYFKDHPKSAQMLREAILNDEGITDFFSNHRGKIVVSFKETVVPLKEELRTPEEGFREYRKVPRVDIHCTYHRAFALRNIFKKPVWMNAGTKPNPETTWEKCIADAFELIKSLGKDTPESMKKRGDRLPRDFASVEARRLKVEKP
ncbi:hypothetical protein J6S88_02660 [bacterium]|nr:hypothetical protein [bacterium]